MKKILIALLVVTSLGVGAKAAEASTTDVEAQLHYAESLVADLESKINHLAPSDTTPWLPLTPPLSNCEIPDLDLALGATGPAVRQLQEFLNQSIDTQINTNGAGAPGQETEYFGSLTAKAVARFQSKYATAILTPLGLSQGTGYWGVSSRHQAEMLCHDNSDPITPQNNSANQQDPQDISSELSKLEQQSGISLDLSDLPADTASSLTEGLAEIIGDTGDKEFLNDLEDLITAQVGKEKLAELEKTYSPRQVADLVFVLPSIQAGINQLLADYLDRQQK
jgi:hypothetical protein